jgi:hypothetical protein
MRLAIVLSEACVQALYDEGEAKRTRSECDKDDGEADVT